MSGCKRNLKARKEKKPLSHGWIVVPSKTYPDRVYFYNTVTKCSTWTNPCEDRNKDHTSGSSEKSSPEINSFFKPPASCNLKKNKQEHNLFTSDSNFNIKINNEIEDYDEQEDENFTNVYLNAPSTFNSSYSSPSSSPESDTVSKYPTKLGRSSEILENDKTELWTHFVSSPDKPNVKKSVALSDLIEPSTSQKISNKTNKEIPIVRTSLKDCGKNSRIFSDGVEKKILKKKKLKKSKRKSAELLTKLSDNMTFNKSDKTPAQNRLLKFRKHVIKSLAAKAPDVVLQKEIVDNNNKSVLDKPSCSDSFNDGYSEKIECDRNDIEYSEEMDWEPSSEESDVQNINVFRQQYHVTNDIPNDIFLGSNFDNLSTLPSMSHSWFLVLDTNIFVSCLNFVKNLRDTKVPGLGYPVLYVPWRVLQELDHLKDTRIDSVNKSLNLNVRKAIAYLNESFKANHPRVFGQSFEEFKNMVFIEASAPDDEILQTCIQFQRKHCDKKLVLLTNDKNLESKAIVSGVEVYSKETFQKKYLNYSSQSATVSNVGNTVSSVEQKIDSCLCEVKSILKEFLTAFVETEIKIAFEVDWLKIIYRKPPWSLLDALECLLKHWRSVFFVNFTKETKFRCEELLKNLFKKEPVTTKEVEEIITISQRLISSISSSNYKKEKRPYLDLIPSSIAKLDNAIQILHSQTESCRTTTLPSTTDHCFRSPETSTYVFKVKNLFKDIWDSLRNFCCSLSDVINSSSAYPESAVQQIKLKIFQISKEVEEMVIVIEKLLEVKPHEIHENHPLIIHFSQFLFRVFSPMASSMELKDELPKCLTVFFTDTEGRSLLTSSLNDFKEFIQDLSKASEYFNANYTL